MLYLGSTLEKKMSTFLIYSYTHIMHIYSYINKNKDLGIGQIGCTIEWWHILYSNTVLLHVLNEAKKLLQAVPRREFFLELRVEITEEIYEGKKRELLKRQKEYLELRKTVNPSRKFADKKNNNSKSYVKNERP